MMGWLLLVLCVLWVGWVVCCELDRRKGSPLEPVAAYYRTTSTALVPWNAWVRYGQPPQWAPSAWPEHPTWQNHLPALTREAHQLLSRQQRWPAGARLMPLDAGTGHLVPLLWQNQKHSEHAALCPTLWHLLTPGIRLAVVSVATDWARSGWQKAWWSGWVRYYLCLAGELQVHVNQQRTVLKPGDALLFDPSYPHAWHSLTAQSLWLWLDLDRPTLSSGTRHFNAMLLSSCV